MRVRSVAAVVGARPARAGGVDSEAVELSVRNAGRGVGRVAVRADVSVTQRNDTIGGKTWTSLWIC